MFSGDRSERKEVETVVYYSTRGWGVSRLATQIVQLLNSLKYHKKKQEEGLTSMRVSYIDVCYQSHASDTGVTENHENDPCPVRQAQQLELSHRATPRRKARFTYQV
jgi:hypothetical protein